MREAGSPRFARTLLALGAAAYFVAALAWLGTARPPRAPVFAAGSIHDTSPRGLSLAYRYLAGRPGTSKVAVLTRRLDPDEVAASGVVFRVRPKVLPFFERPEALEEVDAIYDGPSGAKPKRRRPKRAATRLLTPREEEWVRGGGRLVLAVGERYGAVQVATATGAVRKAFPLWPGVVRVSPAPPRVLGGPGMAVAHAVLVLGGRPLLSRWTLGRGELLVLATPEILENQLLPRDDHLALLEALAGTGRALYFDEHAHGIGGEAGLVELLARWGLGPLLALLVVWGGLAFWRGRSRLGPAADDRRESRSDAVDLLDSLGQLYERSLRRDDALALYHGSLARAVAVRTGLRGEALAARIRDLTGGRSAPRRGARDLGPAAFVRGLTVVNDGFRRLRHEPR